ncbi:MAG: glutamine synthetase [Solirubrobacterales bacterium 70-9]|nr:MAG: glutamine synthetase [Solirubrobacterales bacterium 70-9]
MIGETSTVETEAAQPGILTRDRIAELSADSTLETIILCLPDLEGRLLGKRLTVPHFVGAVMDHGAEACQYLLASDVEMVALEGNELVDWSTGYGDLEMRPDLSTARLLPWEPGSAIVMADAFDVETGAPVDFAPRQILRAQLDRLEAMGFEANVSTELEFIAFRTTYREAWERRYRDLTPMVPYNSDYAIFDGGGIEPLVGRIRREMAIAGMTVEGSKGECNLGQHEINFQYGPAMRIADEHVIYKAGAKEIARQMDMALTFMAKFDQREGNSCHVHFSLIDGDGANAFAADQQLFDRFVAGQLYAMRELTLMLAPQVNSYKRFVKNSFAPTAISWGRDNRLCPIRVLGRGEGLRFEHRLPGADVNPYLAVAAIIAAGIDGVERELELEPPVEGNAYEAGKPEVPRSLDAAIDAFATSEIASATFGRAVVDHLLTRARAESAAAASVVTEWERIRGFERI